MIELMFKKKKKMNVLSFRTIHVGTFIFILENLFFVINLYVFKLYISIL